MILWRLLKTTMKTASGDGRNRVRDIIVSNIFLLVIAACLTVNLISDLADSEPNSIFMWPVVLITIPFIILLAIRNFVSGRVLFFDNDNTGWWRRGR